MDDLYPCPIAKDKPVGGMRYKCTAFSQEVGMQVKVVKMRDKGVELDRHAEVQQARSFDYF